MRHLLLSCLLRGRSPLPNHHHHLPLLRALSSAPSPISSDAELRKYAGYALLLLGCGAATYYSFPFPADALHKKAVPFKYAPLPEDLHAVSNWSGTHEVHTRVLLQPDSVEALEDALAAAHKERRRIRPLGSGLSPNGLALTRAGMVNLALMDQVLDVDVKKKTVTVQAGIRVAELVDALREHGLTLQNFASIREQQVGGFTQVGAHGTGARLPPVDEQVISMKLVTPAKGTIELSREKDPELFYLARCGLGGLGVVAEVTLQCVERHQLVEHTFVSNADEVKKNHKKWLSENKHIKYLWIPYTDAVVVVKCNPPSKWRTPKLTSKYGKDEALKHVRDLYREDAKKKAQASISSFMSSAKPGSQKYNKSVSSMLCKTPEEVVKERHNSKTSQPTLEHCTKKSKEAKQIVDDHIADFFYENGIPLNAVNSRSWEIMLESIGQYGPGYRSPSYHEMRNPLLDRAVEKTNELRKKHEEARKEYGCTLMSDGCTDTRHRHLINFLANSPAGTFFLGSVDASSEVADAVMLANLLEKQIEKIGKEYVVQVVTDNGANFKAAGRILMDRIPTLFWTPCAAHCLDLLLEDLNKIKDFNSCINNAKKVCRFIYKHGRLLDQMRDKLGGDLVRPAVTRFATSFLTLASMYKHKAGLRSLFVSTEWHANKLSTTDEGRHAERTILSATFWTHLENCLKASQPLLIALRIADGDETPAAPEIMAAMDHAKNVIKESLNDKPNLLHDVLGYFEKRWDNQMEQKLYGAALFLNPAKFFPIKENNRREAARLRTMFNDVLWKMVPDDDEQSMISKQADDHEQSRGDAFSKPLAIKDKSRKNPVLWWGAHGGLAFELQTLAKRVVSLCCSALGCERNWSTFSQIHTKRRNKLEHKRLNKLVFVSYNRKMSNRFLKLQELGSKGKKTNPLLLEEFQWESEWVDAACEPVHNDAPDLNWTQVDEAMV